MARKSITILSGIHCNRPFVS